MSATKRPEKSDRLVKKISDETLRSVMREWQIETELKLITERLHADPACWETDPGLVARRNELIRRERKPLSPGMVPSAPQNRALIAKFKDLLIPWTVMQIPYMYDGIYDPPHVQGTSGGIHSDLYAGGLGFFANLEDLGTKNPHIEKWWVRTWRNSVVFPAASQEGALAYRFGVSCDYTVYRAPVYSGRALQYATLGSISNAVSSPVDEWTNWETVAWPLDVTFPNDGQSFGSALPITGWIPVEPGDHPALGFIYGLAVGIASGYIQSWGSIGTLRLPAPGMPIDYTLFDQIEYRFEPLFILKQIEGLLTQL